MKLEGLPTLLVLLFRPINAESMRGLRGLPRLGLRGGGPFIKRRSLATTGSSGANGGHGAVDSGGQPSLPTIASSLANLSPGRRRACSLYIWDAPSALLYRWCNHLMKDRVYEGRGGKKVSVNL